MNCKRTQQALSAYLDGELSGPENLQVRSHLADCGECREELDGLRVLKSMLGCAPTPEPSSDFEERLVRGVIGAEISGKQDGRRIVSVFVLSGVAAAAMVATLLFLTVLHRPHPAVTPNRADQIAFEVDRDQAYVSGTDPLGGARVVVPTSYVGR